MFSIKVLDLPVILVESKIYGKAIFDYKESTDSMTGNMFFRIH